MLVPKYIDQVFRNWPDHLQSTDMRLLTTIADLDGEKDGYFGSPFELAARLELLATIATSGVELSRPAMFVVFDGEIEGSFALELAAITPRDRERYSVRPRDSRRTKRDLHMVLRTRGGDPDAAYVAMRYLQRAFRDVNVAVMEHAYSAGTLFLLGASQIHLGPVSVMGPLDFQVPLRHYLGEDSTLHEASDRRGSIEEIMEGFEEILRRQRASDTPLAADWWHQYLIASGVTSDVLGACLRLRAHAQTLAVRLLQPSAMTLPQTPDAVANTLVRGYHDHGFGLDPAEAKQLLGAKVCVNTPLARVADNLAEALWYIATWNPKARVHLLAYEHLADCDIGPDASYDDLCAAFERTTVDPLTRFSLERMDAGSESDDDDDEDDEDDLEDEE